MPATADTRKTRRATAKATAPETDAQQQDRQPEPVTEPQNAPAAEETRPTESAVDKQHGDRPATDDASGTTDGADTDGADDPPAVPEPIALALAAMKKTHRQLSGSIDRRRADFEASIADKRAEFEASIADETTQLAEADRYIRAIERQTSTPSSATGSRGSGARAPRGQNREKILPLLADGRPRTSREISDTTGIGRGSADRTLTTLREQGLVVKSGTQWTAVEK